MAQALEPDQAVAGAAIEVFGERLDSTLGITDSSWYMSRRGHFEQPAALTVVIGTVAGGAPCTILQQNATYIKCVLSRGQMDKALPVTVWVNGRGNARTSVTFTYSLAVASISASKGSLLGGTPLVIRGQGFPVVHDTYV